MPHIRDFKSKRVHFIGIGGCSMSGLAELLHKQGYIVSGSDRDDSHKVEALRKKGIPVAVGHRADNVRGADLVVYTAAIDPDNIERVTLEELGIPSMERAQLLGQIMQGYPIAYNVCGAHGKTTTTAMLAQALVEARVNPTVHIGGELPSLGGGTLLGDGPYFLAEACEFNASFLQFHPSVVILLNIDADHLDFYRDIEHIEQTFVEYLRLLPEHGVCVVNGDDARALRAARASERPLCTFGMGEANDWRAADVVCGEGARYSFTALRAGERVARLNMIVPGLYSVYNALATLAAATLFGLPPEGVADSLGRYTGASRRFEHTGDVDGVRLYHDYSHHPTEIRNAIDVASANRQRGRLWTVWQPHTYSRTKKLFDSFIESFDASDFVVITDIYAAREKDPGDIHTTMLLEPLRARGISVAYTPTFGDAERYLRAHWQPGDIMISLGCGTVDQLNEQIQRGGDTPK